MDGGFVAYGELGVEGRHGAVAFEPVDAAFHGVALFVDLGVEGGALTALRRKLVRFSFTCRRQHGGFCTTGLVLVVTLR